MSTETKQRTWHELLMDDFEATANETVDPTCPSYDRRLARVNAWAIQLERDETRIRTLREALTAMHCEHEHPDPGMPFRWLDCIEYECKRIETCRRCSALEATR